MSNTKVNPNKKYTATEIKRLGLLPWAKDSRTIAKILDSGVLKAKIQKPDASKVTQKRYQVLGKDIIIYIKTYGPALMLTVKTKKYGERKQKGKKSRKGNARKHILSSVSIPSRAKTTEKISGGKIQNKSRK